MTYQRKCKDWITSFLDWTLPRTQAPYSVLHWCSFFALAAAVRRHVQVGRNYLGSWDCNPSLYVFFVADAGVITKSTSIGLMEELLDEVPTLVKAPNAFTIPVLFEVLKQSPDSSVHAVVSEWGTFIKKAGVDMYDTLTDLYDGKRSFKEQTISRSTVFVDRPVVNLIAATTPIWVQENMSEAILGGGFSSRIITINEKEPRRYQMYYRKLVNQAEMDKLKEDLVQDLTHIAENIHGEFKISEEAEDFMENWFQNNAKAPEGFNRKFAGYYQRRPATIHKLAMLLVISRTDELIINKPDFEKAIEIVQAIEPKIAAVYRAIGKNKYVLTIDEVEAYVRRHGKVRESVLFEQFNADADLPNFKMIIESLILLEKIKTDNDGLDIYYTIPS